MSGRPAYSQALYQIKSAIAKLLVLFLPVLVFQIAFTLLKEAYDVCIIESNGYLVVCPSWDIEFLRSRPIGLRLHCLFLLISGIITLTALMSVCFLIIILLIAYILFLRLELNKLEDLLYPPEDRYPSYESIRVFTQHHLKFIIGILSNNFVCIV